MSVHSFPQAHLRTVEVRAFTESAVWARGVRRRRAIERPWVQVVVTADAPTDASRSARRAA